MNSVTVTFDTAGLFAALDKMQAGLLSEVRPAAQAGAQVLYEEVKLRTPVGKKARKTKSGRVIEPGALKAAIYQAFSQDNSDAQRATYHISWNASKAPHGHLVEFGTSRAPAHPFLRPAYESQKQRALQAAKERYLAGAQKVISGAQA
jgi:HK97 gp10 family phage protein